MRQINIFPDPGAEYRERPQQDPAVAALGEAALPLLRLQALHTPEADPQRVRTHNGAGTPVSNPTCCPLTRAQRPFSPSVTERRRRTHHTSGRRDRSLELGTVPSLQNPTGGDTGAQENTPQSHAAITVEGEGGQWGSETDTPSSWGIDSLPA